MTNLPYKTLLLKSDECKFIAEVLLGSLQPVALDPLRGISSLYFFDARGHSKGGGFYFPGYKIQKCPSSKK